MAIEWKSLITMVRSHTSNTLVFFPPLRMFFPEFLCFKEISSAFEARSQDVSVPQVLFQPWLSALSLEIREVPV